MAAALVSCALFLAPSIAAAAKAVSLEDAITIIQTGAEGDRGAAASMLVESWRTALPLMVREVETFDTVTPKSPLSEDQIARLFPVVDVLRTIVFNKDGSIRAFRETASHRTIRPLVWAARGADRPLRINSTYVLASVVDNRTVCVVLHHLRDPSISPDGRVNLLQVAISMAGYAYSNIVKDTMETLEIMRSSKSDIGSQSATLMDELERRSRGSKNFEDSSPFDECRGYDYSASLDPPVERPIPPN